MSVSLKCECFEKNERKTERKRTGSKVFLLAMFSPKPITVLNNGANVESLSSVNTASVVAKPFKKSFLAVFPSAHFNWVSDSSSLHPTSSRYC